MGWKEVYRPCVYTLWVPCPGALPPDHVSVQPGRKRARGEVRAVSKPKGRHVKTRKDKGTARKASELIRSIACLIRAISVLLESLRGLL